MHYLIDGYNLIGKMHGISLSDPNKEEKLKAFIARHHRDPKDRFTLVFDGQKSIFDFETKVKDGPFTLCFTDKSETADDYIIRTIKNLKNTKHVITISSDRAIILAAQKRKVTNKTCETFIKDLLIHPLPSPSEEKEVPIGPVDYWLKKWDK